jgi:hypothetical protein
MDIAELVDDQLMDLLAAPLGEACPHDSPDPNGQEGQRQVEGVADRSALDEYGLELYLGLEP